MPADFETALIAVTTALAYVIDVLRLYAEVFTKQLPEAVLSDIEENP